MFLDLISQNLNNSIHRHPDALAYLTMRNVTLEEVVLYRIGYSRIVGVPEEDSKDRELFMSETFKGKKYESKIVFPIFNVLGNVTGLVGRSIENKEFKLFFSEEAKYHGALLGLYQALPYIYETGVVFVVEGPFDFMAFQKVYKNTVSSLTMTLNDAQYELLCFFAKLIVIVFDADEKGRFAAEKIVRKWSNTVSVDLGYKDPDKGLKELGLVKFTKFVKTKVSNKLPFVV